MTDQQINDLCNRLERLVLDYMEANDIESLTADQVSEIGDKLMENLAESAEEDEE